MQVCKKEWRLLSVLLLAAVLLPACGTTDIPPGSRGRRAGLCRAESCEQYRPVLY